MAWRGVAWYAQPWHVMALCGVAWCLQYISVVVATLVMVMVTTIALVLTNIDRELSNIHKMQNVNKIAA